MLTVATVLSLLLLAVAAWRDAAVRLIPDTISLGLLAIGIVTRATLGPMAMLASLAAALALFVPLVVLHGRGLMGGGDVKLAAAFATGLAPGAAYHFVVATAFAGGLLGLLYLLLSRLLPGHLSTDQTSLPRASLAARVWAAESWRIRRRASLPYGVAIALGGAFVMLQAQAH